MSTAPSPAALLPLNPADQPLIASTRNVPARMSSTAEFALFVREQLLNMVGFAEKHTVDFVVALAKRAASASALGAALRDEAGIDNGALAAAIFARVPSSGVSRDVAAQQQRKVAADAARRELELNAAYRTLMDDIKPSTVSSTTPSRRSAATTVEQITATKAYRRRRQCDATATATTTTRTRKTKRNQASIAKNRKVARKTPRTTMTPTDQYAREQREIAEFEERLRERDKKRTKKVTEAQGSKAARAEAASPCRARRRRRRCAPIRAASARRGAPRLSREARAAAAAPACVSASKTRSFSSRASR
jgi:hypothetical protein